MALKLNQFTVRGSGRFPFDMLRYDCCWPASQVDVNSISNEVLIVERMITLHTHNINAPTIGRWESFGWRVL